MVLIVAFIYPFFEGLIWNGNYGVQAWPEAQFGATFHDFVGLVVHAMVGGTVAALLVGRNAPGPLHNCPRAGLVAVCADSDLMHPVGALVTGAITGALFVWAFTATQVKWKIDDVLGVWPLHGVCGVWGGIAFGIFGQQALGGLGGVSLASQFGGTTMGVAVAVALMGGVLVYSVLNATVGIRLSQEEYYGADLSVNKIGAVTQD